MSSLQLFFIFCLAVGAFYPLLSLLIGGLHSLGHFGGDGGHIGGDMGHGDVGHHPAGHHDVGQSEAGGEGHLSLLSLLSPFGISMFLACFGLGGLVATAPQGLAGSSVVGVTTGLLAGLAGMVGGTLLFHRIFVQSQASSEPQLEKLVGQVAEVLVPIPGGHRPGTITYVSGGTRYQMLALSEEGPIPRGTPVYITQIQGTSAVVRSVRPPRTDKPLSLEEAQNLLPQDPQKEDC